MSRYAVTNLKQADDVVEAPDREIRFGRKHLDSEQLGVTYERFDPDFVSTDGHHHEVQEEAYVVVSGSGRVKLDDEVVELSRWDVVAGRPADRAGSIGYSHQALAITPAVVSPVRIRLPVV